MSRHVHGSALLLTIALGSLLAPAAGAQARGPGHAPPPRPAPPPMSPPPSGPGVAQGRPALLGPLAPSSPSWPGTAPTWGWGMGAPGWGWQGSPPGAWRPGPGVRPPHRRPIRPAVIVSPWFGYGPYYAPYGLYYGSYYGAYSDAYAAGLADSNLAPSGAEGDAWADRSARPARTHVVEAGGGVDAASLAAELLGGGTLVRVRWTGTGGAQSVTLVVADAARRVLALQTVNGAPYAAVFDGGGRIAFVGATVVRADGVSTTTLVPLAMAAGR